MGELPRLRATGLPPARGNSTPDREEDQQRVLDGPLKVQGPLHPWSMWATVGNADGGGWGDGRGGREAGGGVGGVEGMRKKAQMTETMGHGNGGGGGGGMGGK